MHDYDGSRGLARAFLRVRVISGRKIVAEESISEAGIACFTFARPARSQ